jgi:hypothetical protein
MARRRPEIGQQGRPDIGSHLGAIAFILAPRGARRKPPHAAGRGASHGAYSTARYGTYAGNHMAESTASPTSVSR